MNEMEEIYDELLKSFCKKGDDPLNIISKIGTCDWLGQKWACATNAHTLLIVPMDKTKGYEGVEKYPDCSKVMPEQIPQFTHTLPIRPTERAIKEIPTYSIYHQTKCPDCDGHGEFTHGHCNYDCDYCDGDGTIDAEFSHKEIEDRHYFKIVDAVFSGKWIAPLSGVMSALKMDAEIALIPDSKGTWKKLFSKVGDCFVLTMPMSPDTEYSTKDLKINELLKSG